MVKVIYISIILLSCSFGVSAQSIDQCPEKLTSVFEKYHKLNLEIDNDEIYYVDYTVNALLRSEENGATDQRIQSWMSKEQQVVINDYVEVYSTSEYTASIMLKDKRVNITSMSRGYAQQAKSQLAFSLIDRLFEKYRVASCILVSNNIYKITLLPEPGGLNDFNVEKAEIMIDWQTEELKGFTAIMGEVGEIESMTLMINELNFDYQGTDPFIDFAKKYISNGVLTGKYTGFSLIDNRPNKS